MASLTKIGIVTSKGGHLFQILRLKKIWKKSDRFWVTFSGEDSEFFLRNEKVCYAYYPESRNLINVLRNLMLAFSVLRKERPNALLSCGAGVAVPFFIIGKFFFKTKLIFIEPYDFISRPSLTGKILYNLVDLFLVQHKRQKKWFRKAKYWGSIL